MKFLGGHQRKSAKGWPSLAKLTERELELGQNLEGSELRGWEESRCAGEMGEEKVRS